MATTIWLRTACALALGVGASAAAQGPQVTLTTATDYSVYALAGTTGDLDGVAGNTDVTRGLQLHAAVDRMNMAASSAGVGHTMMGRGVSTFVRMHGRASSMDPRGSAEAGTSQSLGRPINQGPHTLRLSIGVPENTRGIVSVVWLGQASRGADATCEVRVGNHVFNGTATGSHQTDHFSVVAGPRGVQVSITTDGSAAVTGHAGAHYAGSLHVSFRGDHQPGGCDFTSTANAPRCLDGGTLAGRGGATTRGAHVDLSLTGATPNSVGIFVIGASRFRVQLPGTPCLLLVDPVALATFSTDANGDGGARFGVPGQRPLTVHFQAVTLKIDASGLSLPASNALEMDCK